MHKITFDKHQQDVLVSKLQHYFQQQLQQEIGQFDAQFLLDFISSELGAHYYNRGLQDAQVVLASKLDDLHDAIYQLEQPTTGGRP
jgi:uncharacterized protein (DUF2164 family)